MNEYSEKNLAIDLIVDFYKTRNIAKIIEKSLEDLDIVLTYSDVMDYLNFTLDYEKAHLEVEYNMNYNEEEYK